MIYLIVDAGNTNLKLAFFQNDELIDLQNIEGFNLALVQSLITQYKIFESILSSVRNEKDTAALVHLLPNCKKLNDLRIPLKVNYTTKKTLGVDRIANAVAISVKGNGNKLAIDIGTCIKFDFVDANNTYQGGSISPGIKLRYQAMNDYTGALPLLNLNHQTSYIGKSTTDCMHSGVINGIRGELDYFIHQYEAHYPDLTIFMTGGDAKYFDYSLKNNIFALENLTIEGLYLILKANAN